MKVLTSTNQCRQLFIYFRKYFINQGQDGDYWRRRRRRLAVTYPHYRHRCRLSLQKVLSLLILSVRNL